MDKIVCPNCGSKYQAIGQHWTKAKGCSHPELSKHQMDIAIGLILGDWTLLRNYKNALIQVNRVRIASSNESDNLDKLISYFDDAEIAKPKETGDRIYWSVEESRAVWSYMGSPAPGFEYKWP